MSNKTPHPHKELIAEWLEDTSRGIEVQCDDRSWAMFRGSIALMTNKDIFRIAPVKIKIGDRALVAPMRVAPEIDTRYWVLMLDVDASDFRWEGEEADTEWLAQGRCFATEVDAAAMRDALLELLK